MRLFPPDNVPRQIIALNVAGVILVAVGGFEFGMIYPFSEDDGNQAIGSICVMAMVAGVVLVGLSAVKSMLNILSNNVSIWFCWIMTFIAHVELAIFTNTTYEGLSHFETFRGDAVLTTTSIMRVMLPISGLIWFISGLIAMLICRKTIYVDLSKARRSWAKIVMIMYGVPMLLLLPMITYISLLHHMTYQSAAILRYCPNIVSDNVNRLIMNNVDINWSFVGSPNKCVVHFSDMWCDMAYRQAVLGMLSEKRIAELEKELPDNVIVLTAWLNARSKRGIDYLKSTRKMRRRLNCLDIHKSLNQLNLNRLEHMSVADAIETNNNYNDNYCMLVMRQDQEKVFQNRILQLDQDQRFRFVKALREYQQREFDLDEGN